MLNLSGVELALTNMQNILGPLKVERSILVLKTFF